MNMAQTQPKRRVFGKDDVINLDGIWGMMDGQSAAEFQAQNQLSATMDQSGNATNSQTAHNKWAERLLYAASCSQDTETATSPTSLQSQTQGFPFKASDRSFSLVACLAMVWSSDKSLT
jgi:hypothetical protein